jgi:hypothetical protein
MNSSTSSYPSFRETAWIIRAANYCNDEIQIHVLMDTNQ